MRMRAEVIVGAAMFVGAACTGAPAPSVQEKPLVAEKPVVADAPVVQDKSVVADAPEVADKPAVVEAPVVPVGGPAAELPAANFMFVFRGDVVLEPAADVGWGIGKVRRKKTKEGLEGRRDVDPAKLPGPLKALDGAAVTLYGAKGKLCDATLAGLTLYGLSERGDEEDAAAEMGAEELPSEAALVAGLTDKKGSCTGALWARRSDLPAPAVFVAEARADAGLAAKVRAALAGLAGFKALATSHGEYARDKVTWDAFVAKNLRTEVWTELGGSRKRVVAQVGDADNIRCDAYFAESFSAVFEVTAGGLKLLSEAGPWRPAAMFDADGDGALEVLMPPPGLGSIVIAESRTGDEPRTEVRFPSEGAAGCQEDDAAP